MESNSEKIGMKRVLEMESMGIDYKGYYNRWVSDSKGIEINGYQRKSVSESKFISFYDNFPRNTLI